MKKNALAELTSKSIKELDSTLHKVKLELAKLQVEKNSGKGKDTEAAGNKRRELAQILTIKRLKELAKS